MKINYNGKEVELRDSYRAKILFEGIMNKSFMPENMLDIMTYFYCVVNASDKTLNLKFDDFLDWNDEHQEYFTDFCKWLSGLYEQQKLYTNEELATQKEIDELEKKD